MSVRSLYTVRILKGKRKSYSKVIYLGRFKPDLTMIYTRELYRQTKFKMTNENVKHKIRPLKIMGTVIDNQAFFR